MININVKDQNNFPVIDALVYNGNNFFNTDENGNVKAPYEGKLFQFSAVGHKNATFDLKNKTNVDIILERTSGDLEEIVITGEKPKKSSLLLIILLVLIAKNL